MYARLDDCFYDSPTFADVPNECVGVWAKGLAYCNRHLTDGFIPERVAVTFAERVPNATLEQSDPETLLSAMVSSGIWKRAKGGFLHVDYLDHNPSKAAVLAMRDGAKARKDKWKAKDPGTRSERDPRTVPSPLLSSPLLPIKPPKPPSPAGSALSSELRSVLDYWAEKLYPGRKVLFSQQRVARLRARLAEGFTLEQLKLAVDGALKDDWLMGRKDGSPKDGYRDIKTVFRDAAQVEKLLGLTPRGLASLAKPKQERFLTQTVLNGAGHSKDAPAGPVAPAIADQPIAAPRAVVRPARTPDELALMNGLLSKIGSGPVKPAREGAIGGATAEERALASRVALANMGGGK